jgi:hypothetical protein
MRAIDLTEDLKAYVPKTSLTDPRLELTADSIDDLDVAAKQALVEYKQAGEYITASSRTTEARLSYLQDVHGASDTYWKIVGTTAMALMALKLLQGGTAVFKWARSFASYGKKQSSSESSLRTRSHAREWVISH